MAAYGFQPLRHLSGGEIRTSEYTIAIDYSTEIFSGDPVKFVAAGTIEVAAAGNVILGVFQGVSYKNPMVKLYFRGIGPVQFLVQQMLLHWLLMIRWSHTKSTTMRIVTS